MGLEVIDPKQIGLLPFAGMAGGPMQSKPRRLAPRVPSFEGGETVIHKQARDIALAMENPKPLVRGMVIGPCPHGILVSWEVGWAQLRCCSPHEIEVVGLLEQMAEAAAGRPEMKFTHRPPSEEFREYGHTCPCCL